MTKQWGYKLEMEVRDYEVDFQRVVNNSVYINYLEHCRNRYVAQMGIDVFEMHDQGFDLMLTRIDQKYKSPLRPGDRFYVTASMRLEGRLKIVFDQEIRRSSDDKLMLVAEVEVICLDIQRKRPCMPEKLKNILKT
tara:strand:+ start:1060 stop:1467 length:408 start_codon:yes stop_codon:yes gene_type:complete